MEIFEVTDLKKLLYGARLCGTGTTSICLLLRDKTVFKLYKSWTREEFVEKEIEHLNILNSVQNKYFIGPDKIYMMKGAIIGYGMSYVKAKTLKNIKPTFYLNSLLYVWPVLEDHTHLISKEKFSLADVFYKNILFNDMFHVIDLDNGSLQLEKSEEDIFEQNKRKLLTSIIGGAFGDDIRDSKTGNELQFYSPNIKELYRKTVYEQTITINEFFECIKEEIKEDNPQIGDLRRVKNKLYRVESHDDYNSYF